MQTEKRLCFFFSVISICVCSSYFQLSLSWWKDHSCFAICCYSFWDFPLILYHMLVVWWLGSNVPTRLELLMCSRGNLLNYSHCRRVRIYIPLASNSSRLHSIYPCSFQLLTKDVLPEWQSDASKPLDMCRRSNTLINGFWWSQKRSDVGFWLAPCKLHFTSVPHTLNIFFCHIPKWTFFPVLSLDLI